MVDEPVRLRYCRSTGRAGSAGRTQRLASGRGTGHRSSPRPRCAWTALRCVSGSGDPDAGRGRGRQRRGGRRRRGGRSRPARGHRATGGRPDPGACKGHEPRRRRLPGQRLRARVSRPGVAREILDLPDAGARSGRRSVVRSASASICARAGRAVPGPMRRRCCTSANPGSPSPTGEIWAVHTGVERQPHALRGAAVHRRAGDRRRRAAAARRGDPAARASPTHSLDLRLVRRGLDAVARRFHRFLRARRPAPERRSAGHPERLGGGLLRPRPGPA